MMKRKAIWLALCVGLLLSLSACADRAQLDGRLLSYDLGEGALQTSDGRSVPYALQGVLGIPEGENCPVVILVHGAHPIQKASEDRYDIGFNYLAQALSEQGNLVISVNVGMNYSFEDGEPLGNERTMQILDQQLALLKQAIAGDRKVFGYDLTGVGDLERVFIMGHSRGGLDVLEWVARGPKDVSVLGAVAVAPALYKEMETEVPDLPIGILIPQRDGDVISLDGNDIYELIVSDTAYTKTAELIYLKNANHGHFNTQLTQPDLNSSEEDLSKLIPAEAQRSFLVRYLTDFIAAVTARGESVFASAPKLESRAYDCEVLLRVHAGGAKSLYSADSAAPLCCAGNATAAREIASFFPDQNTVGIFKMPGGAAFQSYSLQHIVWAGAGASVAVPAAGDLTGCRFLDIDMAVDSFDLTNKDGQAMTLRVVDADGSAAELDLGRGEAALLWQEGTLNEIIGWDEQLTQEYSTFTPLVTCRVALSALNGVDLSRIETLELLWPASAGGSLMLRSVSAVPDR